MTKMDQFVKAMEVALALSRELKDDGIDQIVWSIGYSGTPEAKQEFKQRISKAMIDAGYPSNKEVA